MILQRSRVQMRMLLLPLVLSSAAISNGNGNFLTTESFSPLHYELVLDFSASEGGDFLDVMTSVTATARRSGHSLRLDFRPVYCHVHLDQFRRTGQSCANFTFELNRTYNIMAKHRLKLRNYGGVFYRTEAGDGKRKIVVSNFKMEGLREVFLVVGRLQDRPTFRVKVVHPDGTVAFSNSSPGNRTMWASWLRTPFQLGSTSYRQLSVAVFASSGFRRRSFGKTSVWVCRRRETRTSLGKFAFSWTQQMVQALRQSLQLTAQKLDLLVLPTVAASASRGIIVLPEKEALVDDATSTAAHRRAVAETLAIKLAASFFSDAGVGAPDPWLVDAIAIYYGTRVAAQIAPEWEFDSFFVSKVTRAALSEDILRKIPALSGATGSSNSLTTLKGAAILKMLANVFQPVEVEDTFKYLVHQQSLSVANIIHGLRTSFSTPGNGSILGTVFGSWMNQEGYPLLSVTRNYREGSALVTQEPFLSGNASSALWWLPLTYRTSLDHETRSTWFSAVSNETKIRDLQRGSFHWILLNPEGTGYYRVQYDRLQWTLLRQQLLEDHEQLEVESRAVLLDDAFTLARHRLLDYSTVLSMAPYLARETSPVVWTLAIRHLDGLLAELPYDDRHRLQLVVDDLVSLRVSGGGGADDDDDDDGFLRGLLGTWSCRVQLPCCNVLQESKDLREAVLCRQARESSGNSSALLQDLFTADPATLRPTLLAALACTSDHNVLTRLVNSSAHGEHGLHPVETFSAVAHNPMIPEIAAGVLKSLYRDTPWIPEVLRIIADSPTQDSNLFYLNDLLELYKIHPGSTRLRLDHEAKLQIKEWLTTRKSS